MPRLVVSDDVEALIAQQFSIKKIYLILLILSIKTVVLIDINIKHQICYFDNIN